MKIALLLSTNSFEDFYIKKLGFSHESYIRSYRNDFSWNYASGLAKRGVNTAIYVPSVEYSGRHQTDDGFLVRFIPVAAWYWPWLKLKLLSKTPIGRYVSEVAHTAAIYQALCRSLVEDSIDLLYIQEYWTGRFDILATHIKLPVIAADHGGKSYHQLKWFKRRAFHAAKKITVQTPDELSEASKYGADAVLLTNGVDTDFYTPALAQTSPQKTVLVVARLENKQKRISDLINAMTYLDAEWRLDIVGDGPDRAHYEALVNRLNLSGRVVFSGFIVDKKKIREMFQECGVFVLPSANEGLALVVLEAMSCGAAIVVTNIRAFETIVEHGQNGVKVGVGDAEGISKGITTAFKNRYTLGKNARATVQNRFSQDVVFEQLGSLISECAHMAKKPPRR